MKKYKLVKHIAGWAVFLTTLAVYLFTLEPAISFHNSAELTAAASKLQVGLPPGSPFFLLSGRLFLMFAPGAENVAFSVNILSAVAGAFVVLFLYLTITRLAEKIIFSDNEPGPDKILVITGSGIAGALALAFSGSFWSVATEANTWVLSLFLTATILWAILKWEAAAERPGANRWIVLTAFLAGISTGVNLAALLVIPAAVFVVYFKKYNIKLKGFLIAAFVSIIIMAGIRYGVVFGVPFLLSLFELLFVNGLQLPFESGTIFFIILLSSLLIYGLYATAQKARPVFHTVLLCTTMVLIGYSSFSLVIIRSSANPPINHGNPDDIFSFIEYLRDGEKTSKTYTYAPSINLQSAIGEMQSNYVRQSGRYINSTGNNLKPESTEPDTELGDHLSHKLGYIYGRYFMWNFAGRQNDLPGDYGIQRGNWISGIIPLDEKRLGLRDYLPYRLRKNKGEAKYYMLPLLIGLAGFLLHLQKRRREWFAILLLFLCSGIFFALTMSFTNLQEPEKDYLFLGSFYAFAVWIGLGVITIFDNLPKKFSGVKGAIISTMLALIFVPGLMAMENAGSNDRSGRYTARDMAYNYLKSCEPGAILFTAGEKHTFPLWYIQQVEGFRTDVRVVNLDYLNYNWYIRQMRQKVNESPPLTLSIKNYQDGSLDFIYLADRIDRHIEASTIIEFVTSDDERTKTDVPLHGRVNFIPSSKFSLSVDKEKVIETGTVSSEKSGEIPDTIKWEARRGYMDKSGLVLIDILANNKWKRPLYFSKPLAESGRTGLDRYLQMEGTVYRLVPLKKDTENDYTGHVNTNATFANLMDNYKWRGLDDPEVYHDKPSRDVISGARHIFARLAGELKREGKTDSALAVLDKSMETIPGNVVPYDDVVIDMALIYHHLGEKEKALAMIHEKAWILTDELEYYFRLNESFHPYAVKEIDRALSSFSKVVDAAKEIEDEELHEVLENNLATYERFFNTTL